MDRFHLVIDLIDRLPQIGSKDVYLKQMLQDKLYSGDIGLAMEE